MNMIGTYFTAILTTRQDNNRTLHCMMTADVFRMSTSDQIRGQLRGGTLWRDRIGLLHLGSYSKTRGVGGVSERFLGRVVMCVRG
jgi:hypothetical protein